MLSSSRCESVRIVAIRCEPVGGGMRWCEVGLSGKCWCGACLFHLLHLVCCESVMVSAAVLPFPAKLLPRGVLICRVSRGATAVTLDSVRCLECRSGATYGVVRSVCEEVRGGASVVRGSTAPSSGDGEQT